MANAENIIVTAHHPGGTTYVGGNQDSYDSMSNTATRNV